MSSPKSLVVAVHDISPLWARETTWLLDRLHELGSGRLVLKVVPLEAGHRLDEAPALVARLHEEVGRGAEIVLHGLTHRMASPASVWRHPLRGDRAEFSDLEAAGMRQKLEQGRAILEGLGLASVGFCAPTWAAAPGLDQMLRELGFRYRVGLWAVRDLKRGASVPLLWAGYMGGGRVNEGLTQLGAAACSLVSALPTPLSLRIFLHPQGAPTSRTCGKVLARVSRELEHRQVRTFLELLG